MANTKVSGDLIQDGAISQNHLNESHGITTTDIGEGTSLYYTDTRVASYLSANNYITTSAVTNSANWDTAYSWGDHSLAGYLTSFTETDPVFTASAASGITSTQITNWDTAYGWGDHSTQSYATQTYVNTAVANLVDSAPTTLDTLNELAAALGDDPNFATTVTASIGTKWTQDNTKISNWDTAYSWGNHASAGYLTSFTETDPTVPAHVKSITTTNISNWNTAYGWGNHASAGYLTSVTNISGYSSELIRTDNRTIAPNELSSGRMSFGFTSWNNNDGSPYADFIHLRGYTDSSGGSDNLLMFKKSGIGMRIWQQTYGSATAYSSYADVITTNGDDQIKSGYFQSNSSLRAPIFYDSNDTSYYVDANGRSVFSTLNLINGGSGMQNNAALNIGFTNSGETRAIDIDGGWSTNENKSITFIHGSALTNIVGQINCQHNGPGSRFRWGKLYHNGDSSTYTMELISESATSAYLQVAGSMRSPIFYDSNDTNYYIDPSALSRVRGIQIRGAASSQSTLDQIGFWDQTNGVPGTTSAIGFKQVGGIWADHGGTSGGYNTYFSMDTANRGWIFRRVTAGGSDYTGFNVASIRNDGTAYFNGDVTANYSDIRLKTVLGKIENPLQKIKTLNGFYYEPNDIAETYGYEKEIRLGLSAQDVETVFPEIVKDAPIGDGYKTVDYAKLVPVLIEAIKELSNKVEDLENKLNGTN